ncbi:MAG: hypothetical protein QW161_06430 [Candidatus Bathyarchaeia archaeon]
MKKKPKNITGCNKIEVKQALKLRTRMATVTPVDVACKVATKIEVKQALKHKAFMLVGSGSNGVATKIEVSKR